MSLLFGEEPEALAPPTAVVRWCRCEHKRPYAQLDWVIEPEGGWCRNCRRALRSHDVRKMYAIARDARKRAELRGLLAPAEPPVEDLPLAFEVLRRFGAVPVAQEDPS